MSGKSSIEWTEHTWNPIVGCSIVSPGCTNCYAMKMAARIEAIGNQPRYAGTTRKVNGNAVWTGKLAQAPDSTLLQPLKRHAPTTYFVNSMGDLFHEDCPDEWIDRAFVVMTLAEQHTFQILTKRAERMRSYFQTERAALARRWGRVALESQIFVPMIGKEPCADARQRNEDHFERFLSSDGFGWPLKNIWLGVSTERQQEADERIPLLLQTPAAVRFISAEPLLGPISLRWAKWDDWSGPNGLRRETVDHLDGARRLDWVIVGGESGHGARPMDPAWARELRDQCREAGVPYFFKQWGAFVPETRGRYRKVSKKVAGRLLDGVEYNELPVAAA